MVSKNSHYVIIHNINSSRVLCSWQYTLSILTNTGRRWLTLQPDLMMSQS